jgi:hypothetical protein
MEKNLVIKVDDRLIDLINKIEEDLRNENPENSWHFPISWAFDEMGVYASGIGTGIEYGCSIGEGKNGEWQSVFWREVGKHDNDNWEQHKFDTDYEAPEEN